MLLHWQRNVTDWWGFWLGRGTRVAWCDYPFRKSVSLRLGVGGRTLESSAIVMILSNNSEFDYVAESIMQKSAEALARVCRLIWQLRSLCQLEVPSSWEPYVAEVQKHGSSIRQQFVPQQDFFSLGFPRVLRGFSWLRVFQHLEQQLESKRCLSPTQWDLAQWGLVHYEKKSLWSPPISENRPDSKSASKVHC